MAHLGRDMKKILEKDIYICQASLAARSLQLPSIYIYIDPFSANHQLKFLLYNLRSWIIESPRKETREFSLNVEIMCNSMMH
jgi:hypothetical protein